MYRLVPAFSSRAQNASSLQSSSTVSGRLIAYMSTMRRSSGSSGSLDIESTSAHWRNRLAWRIDCTCATRMQAFASQKGRKMSHQLTRSPRIPSKLSDTSASPTMQHIAYSNTPVSSAASAFSA